MSILLSTALTRVAAMQIECMSDLGVTADAKAYFYHAQEAFPYFTNRVGAVSFADDGSEDFDRDTYTIIMRLVINHLTADYVGQNESNLHSWIPAMKTFFHAREGLQHDAATTWLNGLIRARISQCTGFRIFENAGISAVQIGTEFSLVCEFDETIDPEYA